MEASNAGGVGKNRNFDKYLAIRSVNDGVLSTMVDRAVYHTDRHASVNPVYHSQHGRPRQREEKRTEFNCKCEVKVNLK